MARSLRCPHCGRQVEFGGLSVAVCDGCQRKIKAPERPLPRAPEPPTSPSVARERPLPPPPVPTDAPAPLFLETGPAAPVQELPEPPAVKVTPSETQPAPRRVALHTFSAISVLLLLLCLVTAQPDYLTWHLWLFIALLVVGSATAMSWFRIYWRFPTPAGIGLQLLLILAVLGIEFFAIIPTVYMAGLERDKPTNDEWRASGVPSDSTVQTMTESLIRPRLKAPKTAEFSRSATVTLLAEDSFHAWTVEGYFDAQNVYGTFLRGNYLANVSYDPDADRWSLQRLQVNGESWN